MTDKDIKLIKLYINSPNVTLEEIGIEYIGLIDYNETYKYNGLTFQSVCTGGCDMCELCTLDKLFMYFWNNELKSNMKKALLRSL